MARRHQDIFDACSRGDKHAVSRIISAGTDPRKVRSPYSWATGETLLHTASRYVLHVHSFLSQAVCIMPSNHPNSIIVTITCDPPPHNVIHTVNWLSVDHTLSSNQLEALRETFSSNICG